MLYHDNTIRPEYDENGHMLNNWDPDRDFSENSYIRVFFRIETKGFNCMHGYFENSADRESFRREAESVLDRFGIGEGGEYNYKNTGIVEHLYIHPQEISGCVKMRDVKPIALALNACNTCSVRWVDVYEEVYAMDEKTFLDRLEAQKQAIKADLAEQYQTKRSNLVIVPSFMRGPEERLSHKYHIARTNCHGYQDGPCYSFICKVREEMVAEGLIVKCETKHGAGYRTAKQPKTKREKKAS